MPSVSTMILNALIITGEKTIEVSSLTTGEQNYYLSRLNSMMDSWSNERMMIHSVQQTSFALTNSQGSYSIGSGGDFNMTRPTRIVDPCFIRDSNNFDIPLEIINVEAYGRIVLKTLDGTWPQYLYYDRGYSTTSTGRVYFWPEPGAGLSTFINTLQPLQNFSTVSVTLQLPPGYQDAIESNFAMRVAPGFVTLDPLVIKHAMDSKKAIKSQNAFDPVLRLDYGLADVGARTNILTGP